MPNINSKRYLLLPQTVAQLDMSGALQTATSRFLQKENELDYAINADFRKQIGSAVRRDGYEQVGRTIQAGNDGLGACVYRYGQNNKIIAGINDATGTTSTVQFLDVNDYWNPIITGVDPSTRFSFLNYLDELYVAGYSKDLDSYMAIQNIDSTLVASTSRNVQFAPKAKFITDYQNSIYAIGVQANGVKYSDRFYRSSPAIGFITRAQGDQIGTLWQLKVDSVRYLKPGSVVDIYKPSSEALVVSGLTVVSVDKDQNHITFAPQSLTIPDNAELWPAGRKGKLSFLWNTDYPTPETADWERIPPGTEENQSITAYGKNNNRLLLFTRNSLWKWDGNNLVQVSDSVGCIAPRSVKNVAGWTLFLHSSGLWSYNDASGQIRLLTRGIDNYIKAFNLATIDKASAVVNGRVYKLGVGEIADLTAVTTSTSTSSTSTSSTSTSTSSTSTSSTSMSSTSTSQTFTTTSTSSTSSSTSSTSHSTSSTSTSTTSQSTSSSTSSTTTTTIASTKKVLRIVYDFDSNTTWIEQHKREFRDQFMHTMNGYTKPYFQDETGRLWRDETGNLDGVDTIPMDIEWGRSNHGVPLQKIYSGCIVVSEKSRGASLKIQIDNGNWVPVGQITDDEQQINFPDGLTGTNINYRFSHNEQGDAPSVDGIITYFTPTQTRVS